MRGMAAKRRWRVPLVAALAVAMLLFVGLVAPTYRAQEWSLWLIYGMVALSLVFVWGQGGMFSFGQGAFFGLGGYAYGIVAINLKSSQFNSLAGFVGGVLVGAVVAAILGYFMFYGNVGSIYVAVITLAFSLVLLTLFSSMGDPRYRVGDAVIGGYNGMVGVPTISLPGLGHLGGKQLFTFVGLIAIGSALLVYWNGTRPFGRVLISIRENEARTILLGYDIRRYKLVGFSLGGALAGLAGALYASWAMFISPTVFGLGPAALVAIWVLVGGRKSIIGAFIGVALVQGLTTALGEGGGSATPIVLGVVLILVVILLPGGIVPTLSVWFGRRTRLAESPNEIESDIHLSGQLPQELVQYFSRQTALAVSANNVSKRFGGVQALADVTLALPAHSVHCLIGPNGAGKSTFFKILAGTLSPSTGRVYLDDRDVTKLRPDQRVGIGVGVKMQVPMYYPGLTVHENLWLSAYRKLRNARESNAVATAVLRWMGLSQRASTPAWELSHGEHQWLEIGIVVAAAPRFVLLDEPTAGMTRAETLKTVELIRQISAGATIIVVEHDMEFVRELGAPVVVFHEGQLFTQGSVDEIRSDERVLDIYLGRAVDGRA